MKLDYIEVITFEQNALLSDNDNGSGITILPLKNYLDLLPNKESNIKIQKAIDIKKGISKVYYVDESDIQKYNLYSWVRGCNSVGYKHPTVVKLLKDRSLDLDIIRSVEVETTTIEDIIKDYNVESFNTLKLEMEGYDLIILEDFYKLGVYPPNIIFKNNALTDQNKLKDILALYSNYKVVCQLGDELHLRLKNSKPRVAIWSRTVWALGRIHHDLVEKLSEEYEFVWFNWELIKRSQKLFRYGHWKTFDMILSNTSLVNGFLDDNYPEICRNPECLKKIFVVSHSPLFNYDTYFERVNDSNPSYLLYPKYAGVSKKTVSNFKETYGINAMYTPCGVNLDKFTILSGMNHAIKNIGYIGSPHAHHTKNHDMFKSICDSVGANAVYIYDKHFTEYSNLYKGIDMLICTSFFEAGPLGVFEASACGVPVLSTPVGNVIELQNIKTFTSIEEAVQIINDFRQDKDLYDNYKNNLSSEVRENWNWDLLAHKFWKSFLKI